jgi:cytoskeletal protein CcmA (bactofilin family)
MRRVYRPLLKSRVAFPLTDATTQFDPDRILRIDQSGFLGAIAVAEIDGARLRRYSQDGAEVAARPGGLMWKRDEAVKLPAVAHDEARGGMERPTDAAGSRMIMDLGKSVVINGELTASEDLTIYGQMQGSIKLPNHTLTVGPHADLRAAIAAKAVVVMGAVTGDVIAGERIEIQTSGSVIGDVVAPRLAIADGGSLTGRVQMPDSRREQAGTTRV